MFVVFINCDKKYFCMGDLFIDRVRKTENVYTGIFFL